MEIDFNSVKKDVLTDPEKRKKYYASLKGDISMEKIIELIEITSGVSNANIREIISCFIEDILNKYEDGDLIRLGDTNAIFRIIIKVEGGKKVLLLQRVDQDPET